MTVCFAKKDNREKEMVNWIKKAFVNKHSHIQPILCAHNYHQLFILKETKSNY